MQRQPILKALKAFYRLRPLTGLLLALPGLLLGFWAVWTSWAQLSELKAFLKQEAPIDAGLLQTRLHDLARLQLGQLSLARGASRVLPAQAAGPGFAFELKPERLTELLAAGRPWVQGKLSYAGQLYRQTELRLRGSKYWHLKGPKKSLRVKLDKGRLIEGLREFELESPNDPVLFGETLLLDLARRQGLMSIETGFGRVSINGLDLGVYAWSSPVGEGVLRRQRRIPANVYRLGKLSADWRSAGKWEKVAAYQSKDSGLDQSDRRADLASLIVALQGSEPEFAAYAAGNIALREFATLDALRLLFGGDASVRNYALYFDPYRGRWEPILTAFEGLRSEVPQWRSGDPLFERLAGLPAYRGLRAQVLAQLIAGDAAPERLRRQGEALMAELLPALAQDPYWQANKLLPEYNPLYRALMRPMSPERLQLAFESELETYARRLAWLEASQAEPKAPAPLPAATPPALVLGPGRVEIPATRVFAANQAVRVLAGTTFSLGPAASLIFHGPVAFAGRAEAPIRLRPATAARWGGLVIQGPATAGSRLSYLDASGGSHPEAIQALPGRQYPGLINLHDSHDLLIEHSRFGDNAGGDDLIHTAYVQGLRADGIRIRAAVSDAWDLEFSSGRITGLRVIAAGDDCLDLMDTRLELRDSELIDCRGNGVSAGEASQARVLGSLIADSGTAALIKNASRLSFSKSLLWRNRTGLASNQKSPYYPGLSQYSAESLYESGAQTPLALDSQAPDGTPLEHIEAPRLLGDYRRAPVLTGLRQRLGLSGWERLGAWVSQQRQGTEVEL